MFKQVIGVSSLLFLCLFLCYACGNSSSPTNDNTSSDSNTPHQSTTESTLQTPKKLTEGRWRAILKLSPELELPFNFDISRKGDAYEMSIINGKEAIVVKEIDITGDSIFIQLPVFNSVIKGKFADHILLGAWHNYAKNKDYQIELVASPNQEERFNMKGAGEPANVDGKWEVMFITDDKSSKTDAVGEFKQEGDKLTGTFLTPTGDYRFLEGKVVDDEMWLSCFDGAHAFLFHGRIGEENIMGEFWSGNHWHENWIAYRNEAPLMPDPDTLTYLKKGFDRVFFSFPNLKGESITLNHSKYQDKVVLLQILGTWCPNCMDETQLYADYYKKHKDKGLEIVGLAFETSAILAEARPTLERYIKHFDIEYDILLAGKASKKVASEALPMLNKVISFPTTIFIDKKGKVRKIHTGFAGPATSKYEEFVEEFDGFVQGLLEE